VTDSVGQHLADRQFPATIHGYQVVPAGADSGLRKCPTPALRDERHGMNV
jgi:hypothetical protein